MHFASSGRKGGGFFGSRSGSPLASRALAINVALSLASFALGAVVVSQPPLAGDARGAERELVSGALVPARVSAAGVQPVGVQPAPAALSAAPEAVRGARIKEAQPSWSQLAARAQGCTAAVRADLNYGAGVVVDRSGLVLTNLHVIANTHTITVTPFGSEPRPARVLDSDAELDLALLSATAPSPLADAARLGSAVSLAVGDEVLAVGSPRKMYFSVSRGMVSFPNRLLEGVEYVQTDLPINEGNSGGPLVDREGRVVGIVSFILRESQGLSFALPIDRAQARFAAYLGHSSDPTAAKASPASAGEPPARELPAREPRTRRAH
jgi:S1-C subfamily serine protease